MKSLDSLPSAKPDVPDTNAEDVISRHAALDALEWTWAGKAAIDAVKRLSLGETDATRLAMRIEDYLERLMAQHDTRWIPCSERLPEHPENDDYYLVTIQCEHHDGWDDYVTGFAEWTKHGWDELSCYIGQIKVVAWMPLPKPYKEETE